MAQKEKDKPVEKEKVDGKFKLITSTKRGDRGETSLLSGERVSKSNLRIEVCGNLDESNAALGLAKTFAQNERIRSIISTIQEELLMLGAELASTDPSRPTKRIGIENILQVEKWIEDLQKDVPLAPRFVSPGVNSVSAALDLARSVIRRTERSMVILQEATQIERAEALKYINRLACLLYTMARHAEQLP